MVGLCNIQQRIRPITARLRLRMETGEGGTTVTVTHTHATYPA